MEDSDILNLLKIRDPDAITQLSKKYGPYCYQIAKNILNTEQDVEECLNDTYLNVWNAVPPAEPDNLSAYIGTITRNLAFNRCRRDNALKRGNGNIPLLLSELSEVVSGSPTPEQVLEQKAFDEAINSFLAGLPKWKRYVFVRRYWYADSVSDIAKSIQRTYGYTSMTLTRLRRKLHAYLTERGFEL